MEVEDEKEDGGGTGPTGAAVAGTSDEEEVSLRTK